MFNAIFWNNCYKILELQNKTHYKSYKKNKKPILFWTINILIEFCNIIIDCFLLLLQYYNWVLQWFWQKNIITKKKHFCLFNKKQKKINWLVNLKKEKKDFLFKISI
jgi:hypothetical protein